MRRPTPCWGEGGLSSSLSLSAIIVLEVRGSYPSPQVLCSFVGVSFIARLSFSLRLPRMLVPALGFNKTGGGCAGGERKLPLSCGLFRASYFLCACQGG